MNLDESVKTLRAVPIFAGLDASKLKLLAFASDRLSFDDGEVLFAEGEPGGEAYVVLEGEAVISIKRDGAQQEIARLGKDCVLGEMAIFRNAPRSATVTAKGALVVIRVEGNMFLKMVTENPDAALAVLKELSEKIARSM